MPGSINSKERLLAIIKRDDDIREHAYVQLNMLPNILT